MKPSIDKKGVTSSLSADAAEFVPLGGAPKQANSAVSGTSLAKWKGDKLVDVTEVPRYLTSCYPFVPPESLTRHQYPRFPQQCAYSDGIPPSLPMHVPPPIRFSTWQAVKPGFMGNFPPGSFGSMPFDLLTSLPVDMSSIRGDGLLPIPTKLGPPPPHLLTPHQDSTATWIMTLSSPMLQPNIQSTNQHPHVPVTVPTSAAALSSNASTVSKLGTTSGAPQKVAEMELENRPPSPVLISRSAQTDIPPLVYKYTLEEKPHPLYVNQVKKNQSTLSRSSKNFVGQERQTENEDSDSGYNSPMHKKNLICNATQVIPSQIPSDNNRHIATADISVKSQKNPENCRTNHTAVSVGKKVESRECLKSEAANFMNENMEIDEKKKRKKKKDQRDITRSPRMLGLNTKLLSRSSSSISSSGTRPDEDNEKIDLHSWTDFPPMSSRVAPTSAAPKPLISDERVPLTVERSAHEPPWSIKFSSADQTKSERSRSSSGDKNQSPKCSSPPESVWGKIGRSFKNSQASGLRKELLMTCTESVQMVSSAGAGISPDIGDVSTDGRGGKGSSLKKNRSNNSSSRLSGSGKNDLRHVSGESVAQTRTEAGGQKAVKSHLDQGKLSSTFINIQHTSSSSGKHTPAAPASLSRSTTTTSASPTTTSQIYVSGTTPTAPNVVTASLYKDNNAKNVSQLLVGGTSLPHMSYRLGQSSTTGKDQDKLPVGTANGMVNDLKAGSSNISNGINPIDKSILGAPGISTLMSPGSVALSQAAASPYPPVPALPQTTPFINPAVVPLPNFSYHLPPPSQTPVVNQAFTNYANLPPGLQSVRFSNPVLLATGTPTQSVNAPFQNGGVPFIPLPHTFISSAPYSYYTGTVIDQPPALNASGIVSNSPHLQTDIVFQSQNITPIHVSNLAATQKGLGSSVPVNSHQLPPINLSEQSVSPVSKVPEARNSSTVDLSVQQKFNHQQKPANISDGTQEVESHERRRRRRRRRTKRQGDKSVEGGGEVSDGSQVLEKAGSNYSFLHFEDEDEFPDLLTATHGHVEELVGGERATLSGTSITYSEILKSTWSKAGSQSRTQSLTGSCVSGDVDDEDNTSCHTGTTNESKRARKRRKRREQANKAADVELAEISLEQQWLKEVGLKKSVSQRPGEGGATKATPGLIIDSYVISEAKRQSSGKSGGKKFHEPIAFDIAAMIDAIQKKPVTTVDSPLTKPSLAAAASKLSKKDQVSTTSAAISLLPGNVLDSSAPLQKRGKEREVGKSKKPSPLKKVILKEREQRKRLRLLDEDPDSATGLGTIGTSSAVGVVGGESELSQDALSNKSGDTDGGDTNEAAELSADFSPISQTSPISMSPASPGNSGVNSPVTGSIGRDPVVMKIHSRRFREYCTQILDKEIDQCCTSLLQDLVKFQDRMYHKDPVKAKTKRRVVLGLREVTKHLKLKKIKCVVISPNLEKIQSKGGLDEALNNILNMCREQDVPFVFALGRRALGRACAKLVPVSVVGIFNYEGCENKYRSLISLTAAARTAYNEMVLAVEKEVAEYPSMASQTSSIGGVPGLFAAHMGHSRTPSGCSAISFTSSILSEPISENFPHAEPEVDSKGYEIVRDAAGNVVHPPSKGGGAATDIDDGNEADTEDFNEMRKKRRGRPVNSVRFGDMSDVNDAKGANKDPAAKDRSANASVDGASSDADERSTVGKLSRNVSELTLTSDDNFILKGEGFALKHKNSLEDLEDEIEEFDVGDVRSDDDIDKDNDKNVCDDSENNKWARVSHIDSIHSQNYNLGDEIFSCHSPQMCDSGARGGMLARHSQLSPSSLGVGGGSKGRHAGQKSSFSNNDDNNIDDIDDDEDEETSKRHHQERIKSWLESQSNISSEN